MILTFWYDRARAFPGRKKWLHPVIPEVHSISVGICDKILGALIF